MCLAAGFSAVREFKTPIPALTRVLIAEKVALRRQKPHKIELYLLFDSLCC